MAECTELERKLLDATVALRDDGDDRSELEGRFEKLKQQVRFERFARAHPEWSEQFRAACADYRKARQHFEHVAQQARRFIGWYEVDQLRDRLDAEAKAQEAAAP